MSSSPLLSCPAQLELSHIRGKVCDEGHMPYAHHSAPCPVSRRSVESANAPSRTESFDQQAMARSQKTGVGMRAIGAAHMSMESCPCSAKGRVRALPSLGRSETPPPCRTSRRPEEDERRCFRVVDGTPRGRVREKSKAFL